MLIAFFSFLVLHYIPHVLSFLSCSSAQFSHLSLQEPLLSASETSLDQHKKVPKKQKEVINVKKIYK